MDRRGRRGSRSKSRDLDKIKAHNILQHLDDKADEIGLKKVGGAR